MLLSKNQIKNGFTLLFLSMLLSTNPLSANAASQGGQLTDDSAYIVDATIKQKITGTEPWDDENGAGKDTSPDDTLVRSFDRVTYTVETTLGINNTSHGSEDAKKYSNFKGGTIYFEAKLPEEYTKVIKNSDYGYMKWATNDMKWADTLTVNNGTITGTYQMPTDTITIPGKQSLTFPIDILGCPNNIKIQPEFKIWIQGNDDNEKVSAKDTTGVTITSRPGMNITMSVGTFHNKKITWTENGQTHKGRVFSLSTEEMLYNADKTNVRGLEYISGNVTYDIELKLTKKDKNTGTTTDVTNSQMPLLLNYWNNRYGNTAANSAFPDRPVITGHHATDNYRTPTYPTTKQNAVNNVRYNSTYMGGSFQITQDNNILHVTNKDYAFDGIFPMNAMGDDGSHVGIWRTIPENKGHFSGAFMQVLVPETEETKSDQYEFKLIAELKNIRCQTISGQNLTDDDDEIDDNQISLTYASGIIDSYGMYNWMYNKPRSQSLYSYYYNGDGTAVPGQIIYWDKHITGSGANDTEAHIQYMSELMRFDADFVQPVQVNGKWNIYGQYVPTNGAENATMKYETPPLFAAKPDGTNWTDDEEMKNTVEEDLLFFPSIEALKAKLGPNAKCVACLFESDQNSEIAIGGSGSILCMSLQVLDTAPIGETCQFSAETRAWNTQKRPVDRTTDTWKNRNDLSVSPPNMESPSWVQNFTNYYKTEYDEDFKMTKNHYGYEGGQTLLITGAKMSITKTADKSNYNLSQNNNIATWTIKPSLTSQSENAQNTTHDVYITDTIPKSLTYKDDSCNLSEPNIQETEDSYILTWRLRNVEINGTMPVLTYQTEINNGLQNNTEIKTAVSMSAPSAGNAAENFRTREVVITVSNLASHRNYERTDTPCVELDETFSYDIFYVNNNEYAVPDFRLMDVLPYNGDEKGSNFHGNYTVRSITISAYDMVAMENSKTSQYKLYYDTKNYLKTTDVKNLNKNQLTPGTFGNCGQALQGFMVDGSVPAKTTLTIHVEITPSGNKADDQYGNSASCRTDTSTAAISAGSANVGVIYREINGTVWHDLKQDGTMAAEEPRLKDYYVSLQNTDGSAVTDVYGNTVNPVVTSTDGTYRFQNLKEGNYMISLTPKSEWYVTRILKDNKAVSCNYKAVIMPVTLLSKAELRAQNNYRDIQTQQNIGLYINPMLRITTNVTKNIKDEDGNEVFGTPILTFKVTGTDIYGVPHTWFRTVSIKENNAGEAAFRIPAGTYTITEVSDYRYQRKTTEDIKNCSINDTTVTVNAQETVECQCKITDDMRTWANYSHNDIRINPLH